MLRHLSPFVQFFLDHRVAVARAFEEWRGDCREYRAGLRTREHSQTWVFLAMFWQHTSLVFAFLRLFVDPWVDIADQVSGLRQWVIKRTIERAIKRSDYQHVVTRLVQALESLQTSPNTMQRIERQLNLQTVLGAALAMTKGFAAPAVAETYSEAQQLCAQAGGIFEHARVLGGQWRWHNTRAELPIARARGESLLTLAQQTHDPALLVAAHLALGATSAYCGEFVATREHLEQGITFYECQWRHADTLLELHTADPQIACLSIVAWVLQLLGYPDQARQSIRKALSLAQHRVHPFSLAYAQAHTAVVYQLRQEAEATQEWAEAAITTARAHPEDQAFAMWWAMGSMMRGWALATQGQAAGIAQTRQAVVAWRKPEAEMAVPYWLAVLAEAYGKDQQVEEGLRCVDEGLEVGRRTGQWFYVGELYRLRGEFLRARSPGQDAEAETCFRHALTLTCHQQAKTLELRAAMSLGRLWQQQGKRAEAHELLAPIYGWFTEGFDTSDLQKAKALLAELS